jgi:predicted small lipoprotein YifL
MKKMSKFFTVLLAVMMVLSLMACGSSSSKGDTEVYFADEDWVESGYEGDCINTSTKNLVLAADGTYAYTEGMLVNQISGVIVFNTKTTYFGTYTVGNDTSDTKVVNLSAPTRAINVAAGVTTTSADDSSILEGFSGGDMELDKDAYAINK